MKQNNKITHYWLCGITGFVAGLLAIFLTWFIQSHNFEFVWPLNWPMKITEVEKKDKPSEPLQNGMTAQLADKDGVVYTIGDKVRVMFNTEEKTGTIYGFSTPWCYPILVHFGSQPFNPAYNTKDAVGNNWERYDFSEIMEFK